MLLTGTPMLGDPTVVMQTYVSTTAMTLYGQVVLANQLLNVSAWSVSQLVEALANGWIAPESDQGFTTAAVLDGSITVPKLAADTLALLSASGVAVVTRTGVTGATAISLSAGKAISISLTGNAALTISGWSTAAARTDAATLALGTDATPATVTLVGVTWIGTPLPPMVANQQAFISLFTWDNGTTVYARWL